MPTRAVAPRSDRGSIRDIKAATDEVQEFPYEATKVLEPTQLELRLKKLYEFARDHNDTNLMAASGFITTDYIGDKNALPLSVYRLRKIVDDIKAKKVKEIEQIANQLTGELGNELSLETMTFLNSRRAIKKIASIGKPPVFRRVSR